MAEQSQQTGKKEISFLSKDRASFIDGLQNEESKTKPNAIEVPSISLPKGGGALKGIDEKFSVNSVNGNASFSIPIPTTKGRGYTPALSLSYNSGSGNGVFGLGWNLSLPSIKRKTDELLPQYMDAIDSDIFLFSDAEDLVPEFDKATDGTFLTDANGDYLIKERDSADTLFTIRFYRPRIEGLFARIERWTKKDGTETKWRVITRENITTLFGWTAQARLADPQDPLRVYEWLAEFSFDDKGNCCHYHYQQENATGLDLSKAHNKNRIKNGKITYANCYLSKALYGNQTPYKNFGDPFPDQQNYLFETVFDYGTLQNNDPVDTIHEWDFRPDAFSGYKAGFEIRITRLCKRVLLFHHFKGLNEYDGLVKSLNLEYDTSTEQNFTFLRSLTVVGYLKKPDGTYSSRALPALEFTYQPHEWNSDLRTIDPASLVNAPAGIEEQPYQFIDLYNEGLPGILTEQANGWYYKHNLGNGIFEPAKTVSPKPSFAGLNAQLQIADLDGDGSKQLVSYSQEPKGYFELNDNNDWQPFKNFQQLPQVDFKDPFVRMLDLDGDGKAELVLSEDNVFTWYPNEGKAGFAAARRTVKSFHEETGPSIVFSTVQQTIFLADMSGDGLTDIVRIRNGEVCYWPNLGYGKFGAMITIDNAPVFDHPDSFNPDLLRLADIDGSGTTDIIYLGKNKFSCWKNLSGNRFSTTPFEIDAFPEIHGSSTINVTDLLGNGVACIVWSSPFPKDAQAPLKYIDLMNSRKPHLMVGYKNNLGKEVTLGYTASTHFYVEDKLAGRPWATKLHFPVHCISKTVTVDRITGHTYTQSYKYHHGYYDHPEKEFRGFGMVEQTDTEDFENWAKANGAQVVDATLHQEPVITKQWFHTGAFLRNEKILTQFEEEYWYSVMNRQGFPVTHHEKNLPDAFIIAAPGIPPATVSSLSAEEYQQALRSCKGMSLRSEVFAYDAPRINPNPDQLKQQLTPYQVATHNCIIELLQPKGKNKHAVFVVTESEKLTYQYERNVEDPRIAHNLNIELDEYGNVLEVATIVYPRKIVDGSLPTATQDAQSTLLISYSKNRYTNDCIEPDTHLLRLPAEKITFELKGVTKSTDYYSPADFTGILTNARSDTAFYHELDKPLTPGKAQRRLIEHIRTIFCRNDLTGPLPLYSLESKAIAFEHYQLAYTPELLENIYGPINVAGSKITDALMLEGKFVHGRDENDVTDPNWWIRSGTTQYISGAETVADAQNRFYLPISYTEPFGAVTKVQYYSTYFLMVEKTEDALLNRQQVLAFDFRILSPRRMMDPNDNISEVLTDELGLVKAMAVMGKGNETDDLSGIEAFTSPAEAATITSFFNAATSTEVISSGKALLQHASVRFVYDFDRYTISGGKEPSATAVIIREQHFQTNNDAPVQLSFEYSNGHGQVVMKKMQTTPGLAKKVILQPDDSYTISTIDTSLLNPVQLRWIGNGRTVLNNKGNMVKQYEPYFSVTHRFENLKELVETGVTPLIYYDALSRVVKTAFPDGTFSKTVFDAWKLVFYDQNDTVLDPACTWYINRANRLIDAELMAAGKDPEKEAIAANRAAQHANTPSSQYFDTLGRPVLLVEHNGKDSANNDQLFYTSITLDLESNLRKVTDDRGNAVVQHQFDMLGNKVYQLGMDSGERFQLQNVVGDLLRMWDARGHTFSVEYDILHRSISKKVNGGDGPIPLDHVYEKIIYGEGLPNDTMLNLRMKAVILYDTAGKASTPVFDFNGNPLHTERQFAQQYKEVVNWNVVDPDTKLEPEIFHSSFHYDALKRIVQQTSPDASIYVPQYNAAGLLDKVQVTQEGNTEWFVKNIEYNEKAQRQRIIYGHDVITHYHYDKETFRLIHLQSKRNNNDPLQDLYYTYDPAGNITHVQDKNIPAVFFNNQKIDGVADYSYDALYRLVEANGREHAGQLNMGATDNWDDLPFLKAYSQNDVMAWRSYKQTYRYDSVGNIQQMKHLASGGNWTRDYAYESTSNQLQSTTVSDQAVTFNYSYPHHAQHGFITALPHLQVMQWNFKDELQAVAQQSVVNGIPETTYYVYDSNGQRARKITERQVLTPGIEPVKKSQRIYIDGIEIYREYDNAGMPGLERKTFHVMDDRRRMAMIETRNNVDDGSPKRLVRYQLGNHLGSACLETDGTITANVISYEEYHPFGTTSYQAVDKDIAAAAKRYRYTGMERDEESGLEYHGARYYVVWLGRWLSDDPIGIGDGLNVYAYANNNPLRLTDQEGTQGRAADHDCVDDRVKEMDPKILDKKIAEAKKTKDYAALVKLASGMNESVINATILKGLDSTDIAKIHIAAGTDADNSVIAGLTEKVPVPRGVANFKSGYYTDQGVAVDPSKVEGLDKSKQNYNQVFIVKQNEQGQFVIDRQLGIGHYQLLGRAAWAFHEGAKSPVESKYYAAAIQNMAFNVGEEAMYGAATRKNAKGEIENAEHELKIAGYQRKSSYTPTADDLNKQPAARTILSAMFAAIDEGGNNVEGGINQWRGTKEIFDKFKNNRQPRASEITLVKNADYAAYHVFFKQNFNGPSMTSMSRTLIEVKNSVIDSTKTIELKR